MQLWTRMIKLIKWMNGVKATEQMKPMNGTKSEEQAKQMKQVRVIRLGKVQKVAGIMLCMTMILSMTGCAGAGGADSRSANKPTSVDDVLQAGMNQQKDTGDAQSAQTGNSAENTAEQSTAGQNVAGQTNAEQSAAGQNVAGQADGGQAGTAGKTALSDIDVDLTKLSSTMVYSEVFNMMSKPEDYIGKTIKMDGQFTVYHDESTGNNYFACIIQDATACCAQGMEFVLTDDYSYPADYPGEGEDVAVVGVFDTYMEGDYKYCTLKDAVLVN